MRILVVANLPPYVLGGAENQVARLVEAWADSGYHVEVAGHRIPDGNLMLGRASISTHRIATVEGGGRAGRAVSYFISIARLLHKIGKRFDVIYCRGLGDAAVSICMLKALGQVRLPLLACPINAKGAGDAHFIRSIPCWRGLARLVNLHCDAINIIAPAILSDLIELGIDGPRVSHIPNGLKMRELISRSAVSPVRRMVWIGRLSRQKGLDLLLLALSKVSAIGRQFSLEIVGRGPESEPLLRLCGHLGLEAKVRFTRALSQNGVRAKLKAADVFVLPSRYEGMSNAAIEAMEARLPVLTTRCGGIDTYIDENTGWLCEPNDLDSLVSALISMLDTPDPTLLSMGLRARQLAELHFDIETIARRNAVLMEQLVNGGSLPQ